MRATAPRAVRPNLTVAAELRLALPWPRTTSAVRRGRGGGGAGACDSRERRGDLSPSSLRNRLRLRTQQPRPAPPLSPPPCPAPRAIPRRARPPPEPPPWRDATRGGRKFIRLQTRPSRGDRQLRARRTPSAASPPSSRPGASAEYTDAGGGGRAGRRAYKTLLPASADGHRAPGPAAPRRSGILQLSNNFAESHHVTIQAPSNWPVGRVIQLCLLSPPASQKGPSVERCV